MRLDILNHGYRPGTKLLFAIIRLFSGHPVPDAAKLVFYRPDFYGARAKEVHPRGDARAVRLVGRRPRADGGLRVEGERVRVLHQRAHRDRRQAYQDGATVAAVLADLESAPSRSRSGQRCGCSAS